jgi:hypothetical protein
MVLDFHWKVDVLELFRRHFAKLIQKLELKLLLWLKLKLASNMKISRCGLKD